MKRQRNTKGQQKTAANGQHFHVYSDDNSNKKSRVVTFSKKKLKINDVTNRQPNIQQQQKIVTSRVVDSVHWGENDVSDVGGQLSQPNINEELKAFAWLDWIGDGAKSLMELSEEKNIKLEFLSKALDKLVNKKIGKKIK